MQHMNQSEADYIIQLYSRLGKVITQEDLNQMLSPRTITVIPFPNDDTEPKQEIALQNMKEFWSYIRLELEYYRKSEPLKFEMVVKFQEDGDQFASLMGNQNLGITYKKIIEFMQSQEFYFNKQDIDALVRRIQPEAKNSTIIPYHSFLTHCPLLPFNLILARDQQYKLVQQQEEKVKEQVNPKRILVNNKIVEKKGSDIIYQNYLDRARSQSQTQIDLYPNMSNYQLFFGQDRVQSQTKQSFYSGNKEFSGKDIFSNTRESKTSALIDFYKKPEIIDPNMSNKDFYFQGDNKYKKTLETNGVKQQNDGIKKQIPSSMSNQDFYLKKNNVPKNPLMDDDFQKTKDFQKTMDFFKSEDINVRNIDPQMSNKDFYFQFDKNQNSRLQDGYDQNSIPAKINYLKSSDQDKKSTINPNTSNQDFYNQFKSNLQKEYQQNDYSTQEKNINPDMSNRDFYFKNGNDQKPSYSKINDKDIFSRQGDKQSPKKESLVFDNLKQTTSLLDSHMKQQQVQQDPKASIINRAYKVSPENLIPKSTSLLMNNNKILETQIQAGKEINDDKNQIQVGQEINNDMKAKEIGQEKPKIFQIEPTGKGRGLAQTTQLPSNNKKVPETQMQAGQEIDNEKIAGLIGHEKPKIFQTQATGIGRNLTSTVIVR